MCRHGIDMLMEVISNEESRLREALPDDYKRHPLLATLFRRISEMGLKLAVVLVGGEGWVEKGGIPPARIP